MSLIELRQVSKTFSTWFRRKPILQDINLTIQSGELVGLIGKSGSGKTTLLNLILGLSQPTKGEVKLMGLSPVLPESKTRIGVVFQEVNLPENMKGRELIQLVRSYYPEPLSIEEIIKAVGLQKDEQETWATNLAGGEKQRLYFALALAGNPELLILDEPTRNMDRSTREEFWKQVENCQQRGVAILIVTHINEDIERLRQTANRIITLYRISEAPESGQLSQEILRDSANSVAAESRVISQPQDSTALLRQQFRPQFWVEILQLLRTPFFLLGILFFSGFVAASPVQGDVAAKQLLIGFGGAVLLIIVIDRLGKRVAVERKNLWLKFLRSTPLQPAMYIAVKLLIALLICAVSLLLMFIAESSLHDVQASFIEWLMLFVAMVGGITPFALFGLGLSYLIDPKSYDSIAGLMLPLGLITCGVFPLSQSPVVQDLVAFSPFYHYRQLALSAVGLNNDYLFWLHFLWLMWASIAFSAVAVWAYQRNRVV